MGLNAALCSAMVALSTLANSQDASRENEPETDIVRKLDVAISKCDASVLTTATTLIFHDPARSDGLAFLGEKWSIAIRDGDKWTCLRRPLIAAHVADTLAQGYSNDYKRGIEIQSVRSTLREGAVGSDPDILLASISGLSAIAQLTDLELFETIAKRGNEPARTYALTHLASQCSKAADKILDRLKSKPGFKDIEEIRRERSAIREVRCKR